MEFSPFSGSRGTGLRPATILRPKCLPAANGCVESALMSHPQAAQPRKISFGMWVAAAVVVAAVALLVRRAIQSGFDWALFGQTMKEASVPWICCGWALSVLSYWGRAERWLVMLRPLSPGAGRWSVFRDTAIGYSALILLGRAGELVRPWLIARSNRLPLTSQLSAWLLERVYDTLIVLGFFGFALISASDQTRVRHPAVHWLLDTGGVALGIFAVLCLIALVALHGVPQTIERRMQSIVAVLPDSRRESASKLVASLLSTLRAANSWSAVLQMFAWSLVEWLILILTYFSIFVAFPETSRFTIPEVIAFMGFVSFGSIVQIPGLGGGVQLAAVLVLTEFYAIPLAAATGIALVIWIISFVGIMPLGLALALHQGLSWTQLKSASREIVS